MGHVPDPITGICDSTMNVVAKSLQGVSFEDISIPKLLTEVVRRNPLLLKELVGLL